MSNPRTCLLLLAFHVAFVATGGTVRAQQEPAWTWRDESGSIRTRADLNEILEKHNQWMESRGNLEAKGAWAHLSNADLTGVNLHGETLQHAVIEGANLTGADLDGIDLSDAWLPEAILGGADLSGANLYRATFYMADLAGADLSGTNLADANLARACLAFANLARAELSNAQLDAATLDGVLFEPTSLPKLRGIASAKNLESLTYWNNPDALFQLRKQFVDGGFRDQERKITCALKRREAELSCEKCASSEVPVYDEGGEVVGHRPRPILGSSDSRVGCCGSFILSRVFFDWTCQYGMSPGRPLMLGVFVWFVCALLYFALAHRRGDAGLYRVYTQTIRDDPAAQRRIERISPSSTAQSHGVRRVLQFFWSELLLLRASMFFSLMSAFNIGFRDINFGRWLRLLTRQEFDIKAVGWARVIAGWQSLISVYLIALWVLTYFGRPFG
jgi:hypothetical protein